MSNRRQDALVRLRSIASNTATDGPFSPLKQLRAAREIIKQFGISRRSAPIIRDCIVRFLKDNDENVRTAAHRLEDRFNKTLDSKAAAEAPEETAPPESNSSKTPAASPSDAPIADNFQPGLIDLPAAIRRVGLLFTDFSANPSRADIVLKTALNPLEVTHENVIQLWLAIGYRWKKELGGNSGLNTKGTDLLSQAERIVLCAVCTYLNTRHLPVRTPTIFTPLDDVAFRS